jgi:hypothetical protein
LIDQKFGESIAHGARNRMIAELRKCGHRI